MSDELKDIIKGTKLPLDKDTLAVSGELNKLIPRLSLNGNKFRKMMGSEEVAVAPTQHLNVVIIKMAHTPSRTYYDKVYQEGKISSPVCWSNDSEVADEDVPIAQAKSCNQCKNSVRGSGANGIGTACKLSWRVAVVLANDLEGDIIQVVLPAMSCFGKEKQGRWPFRPYIQMLANNSVSAGRVVTKLQFDEEVNIPKLLFSPVAAIKEHDMEVLKMRSEDSAALQAITLRVKPPHEADPNRPTVQFDVFLETPAEPSSKQIERDEEVSDIIKRWTNKNGS
tara:strand:+ start:843 stop:1685 length:843 start_codon:yes stop_codon:yes gene_type:complete